MKLRLQRKWKYRLTGIAASIAMTFASTAGANETPPEVIDEGDGWQLLMIQPQAEGGLGALTLVEPAPIVMIDSAEGLSQAPLPDVIKQELSADFGNGTEPVSVAVHYDIAEAIAAGTAEARYADFIEQDETAAGAGIASIGCSTGWRHRTKSYDRSFDGFHYDKQLNSGGFTGDIKVDAPITGSGHIDIEYAFKKTAFCLPYTVKFVQARAQAQLDVGDTLLEASGRAHYQTSDRQVLLKPEFRQSFMIGPVPVVLGVEFPIGAGYDVSAQAAADIELRSRAQGELALDVICTPDGCVRNESGNNHNTIRFDDLVNPDVTGSLSFQVDVKPYAFVEARGFLYDTRIASAGAGVEVSAPSRLFYYVGNTCGNALTGAASGDLVNGGYVNVGAQIDFYWNTTLFGDDNFNWFDSPVSSLGGFFREVEVDRFLRGGRKHTALRGELFFADFALGGGKSPLSPIFTGPTSVAMGGAGTFTVKKRSCVPLDEPLNYVVNWGDGSPTTPLQAAPAGSASATHTFSTFGAKTLTAKLTNDAAGRSINEITSRTLNIDADAKPPVPASVSVPATDADGNYTVSWASTVNTTYYQLFRSSNGASYVQLSTPTGTSASLTAQPFGSNRYAVRACNNMGCSLSATSGTIQVGVTPAAPAVTITSMLCHGASDVTWTAPSGATSYKLYASEGDDPSDAGLFYTGSGRRYSINVTSPTHVWVKACGTGGCSGFSAMKTAQIYPGCN